MHLIYLKQHINHKKDLLCNMGFPKIHSIFGINMNISNDDKIIKTIAVMYGATLSSTLFALFGFGTYKIIKHYMLLITYKLFPLTIPINNILAINQNELHKIADTWGTAAKIFTEKSKPENNPNISN